MAAKTALSWPIRIRSITGSVCRSPASHTPLTEHHVREIHPPNSKKEEGLLGHTHTNRERDATTCDAAALQLLSPPPASAASEGDGGRGSADPVCRQRRLFALMPTRYIKLACRQPRPHPCEDELAVYNVLYYEVSIWSTWKFNQATGRPIW